MRKLLLLRLFTRTKHAASVYFPSRFELNWIIRCFCRVCLHLVINLNIAYLDRFKLNDNLSNKCLFEAVVPSDCWLSCAVYLEIRRQTTHALISIETDTLRQPNVYTHDQKKCKPIGTNSISSNSIWHSQHNHISSTYGSGACYRACRRVCLVNLFAIKIRWNVCGWWL